MMAVARLPARREPANSQFFRPSAIGRMRFSTQLLSIGKSHRRPGSASAPPSGSGCSRSPGQLLSRPGSSAAVAASTGAAHRLLVVIVFARRAGLGCRCRPPRAPRHTARRRTKKKGPAGPLRNLFTPSLQRRRLLKPTPTKPNPNSSKLAGSGTVVVTKSTVMSKSL